MTLREAYIGCPVTLNDTLFEIKRKRNILKIVRKFETYYKLKSWINKENWNFWDTNKKY